MSKLLVPNYAHLQVSGWQFPLLLFTWTGHTPIQYKPSECHEYTVHETCPRGDSC